MRRLWEALRGGTSTPFKAALSLGLGLAIAFAVPPGVHTPVALGLALALRLNGVLAVAGTLAWQPFTAPFILLVQKRLGLLLLPAQGSAPRSGVWASWVEPVLVGSPLAGLLAGAAGTALCYAGLLLAGAVRRRRAPVGEDR